MQLFINVTDFKFGNFWTEIQWEVKQLIFLPLKKRVPFLNRVWVMLFMLVAFGVEVDSWNKADIFRKLKERYM